MNNSVFRVGFEQDVTQHGNKDQRCILNTEAAKQH